jgi:hypothetical protein
MVRRCDSVTKCHSVTLSRYIVVESRYIVPANAYEVSLCDGV